MNWKGFLRGAAKVFLKAEPLIVAVAASAVPGGSIAQKLLVSPLIGTVVNAIGAARLKGGTGTEQAENALQSLLVSAPSLINETETLFGIDIPEEAFEPYLKALIQAHYDLLKASGRISSASAVNPTA
jgi:hypothetical protein